MAGKAQQNDQQKPMQNGDKPKDQRFLSQEALLGIQDLPRPMAVFSPKIFMEGTTEPENLWARTDLTLHVLARKRRIMGNHEYWMTGRTDMMGSQQIDLNGRISLNRMSRKEAVRTATMGGAVTDQDPRLRAQRQPRQGQ